MIRGGVPTPSLIRFPRANPTKSSPASPARTFFYRSGRVKQPIHHQGRPADPVSYVPDRCRGIYTCSSTHAAVYTYNCRLWMGRTYSMSLLASLVAVIMARTCRQGTRSRKETPLACFAPARQERPAAAALCSPPRACSAARFQPLHMRADSY